MIENPVNLAEKFLRFSDQWAPKTIAQMNDYHFKLVKIKGEFIWHSHPETDEVFFVISGQMSILFRSREVALGAGDLYVVPRGGRAHAGRPRGMRDHADRACRDR